MEQDIKLWLDSTCKDSQVQSEYWKNREVYDVDGLGHILASSFQGVSAVTGSGILLTGGDSHSKHSVALRVFGMLNAEAYDAVFVNGMDLGADGFMQAKKKLDSLLDHFYDRRMGLCLILDDMEECDCRREILRFLGQKLCEYNIYREQLTPLFLIVMDDREQDIPALLRDCLQLCRLRLPNKTRRAAYLEKYAKLLRKHLSLDVFAQVTEGVGYVQLQDLISLTQNYVASLDGSGLSDEELKTFLADQMPDAISEQPMQVLCRSVQQLVEQLPQLIQNMPISNDVSQQRLSQSVTFQDQEPEEPNLENFEKMPPRQVMLDLYGEAGLADILVQ